MYMMQSGDGKLIPVNSLDEVLKDPKVANSLMTQVAMEVSNQWVSFDGMARDVMLSLRAHGRICGVEDVAVIFVKELFNTLMPLHTQYARVFDDAPLDYPQIKQHRGELNQLKTKYLKGLPEGILRVMVPNLPDVFMQELVELGTAYQSLMYIHNKCKVAFDKEHMDESRENYIRLCTECWENLMKSILDASLNLVPQPIASRSEREAREYNRLIREGLNAETAYSEAMKTVNAAGSKEGFYKSMDVEFKIDADATPQ